MKVAITCDHILERKPVHRLIELACSMFPEATVYTLAHCPGKVLGQIEMHSIRSSFLSNVVKTEKEFKAKAYLIPHAAKKLSIPCSVDLIINFSTGFSHGISCCEKTEVLNYFFSDDTRLEKKKFSEKIFQLYLQNWSKKKVNRRSHLIQSYESLCPGAEVVRPFFNFEDYYFHETTPEGNIALINPGSLSLSELRQLSESFRQEKLRVVIIGEKLDIQDVEFLKNSCSGELAPLFKDAVIVVEGNSTSFPEFALSSFASGRRVYIKNTPIAHAFLGNDLPNYFNHVDELEFNGWVFAKPQQLRDHAARYGQLLFKTGLMRQLKNMGYPYRPQR